MPKISLYTAEGQDGIARPSEVSPHAFGAQLGGPLQDLAGNVNQIGQHFQAIAQKAQDQREDLQAYDLASQMDQYTDIVRSQLSTNTDLSDQELSAQFKQSIDSKMDELLKGTSERVGFALRAHVGQSMGRQAVALRHDFLKNKIADNEAMLDRVTAQRVSDFPKITDPIEQRDFFARQQQVLQRSVENGLLTEEDARKRYHDFVSNTTLSVMNHLRVTDRKALFDRELSGEFFRVPLEDRIKVLQQANEDRRKEEQGQEELFKKFKSSVETGWQVMANRQSIPANMLQDALDGKDGFISPKEAREYAIQNSRPIIKSEQDDTVALAIMQEYHGGPSTQARILSARKKLVASAKGKPPSEALDKALNELQTDERTMRTIEAQEISAGIKFAQDEYKKQAKPLMPGPLGTIQKNKQEAELADINNQIRKNKGKDPGKIVEEFLKKKQAEMKALPEKNKNVLEMVK